jgi:hypothetical protein
VYPVVNVNMESRITKLSDGRDSSFCRHIPRLVLHVQSTKLNRTCKPASMQCICALGLQSYETVCEGLCGINTRVLTRYLDNAKR